MNYRPPSPIFFQSLTILFTLRPWTLSDLTSLVLSANNAAVANNLMDVFPHPYAAESAHSFLAFTTTQMTDCVLAIDVDGQAVGSIGLYLQADIHRKNAELGHWLAQPYWGQDIATQAIRQMAAYGFQKFNTTRISACPFGSNCASQRVLEKARFLLEAQFSRTLFKNGEF